MKKNYNSSDKTTENTHDNTDNVNTIKEITYKVRIEII